jgi:gluconolactonase
MHAPAFKHCALAAFLDQGATPAYRRLVNLPQPLEGRSLVSHPLELTVLDADLDHPEGVAWGADGRVYAGGEAGQVYRLNLADGSYDEYANTGGNILGLALDSDTNVYVCDMALQQVVRVAPDGFWSTYSAGTPSRPMRLPNYPVFDDAGNLYVSDSGDWGEKNGLIFRVRPGGATEVWNETAAGFTNGMCLAADGRALYVVESSPPLVSKVEIRGDGTAGARTVVVELPRTVPDGLALDIEGNLYISLYNPNVVYRYSSIGDLSVMYDDWEQLKLLAPTNIAFAGPELKKLVIANLCGRHLAIAPMVVPGLSLRYPMLPATGPTQ